MEKKHSAWPIRLIRPVIALMLLMLVAPLNTSASAAAPDPLLGSWLFDDAPSYPGVTMMQVVRVDGAIRGTLTTRWYGAIAMRDASSDGRTLSFTIRNLNDRDHPTRRWTARIEGGVLHLTGDIWYAHTAQAGRRGSAAEVRARTFHPAGPLPTLRTLGDDGLARTPPMGWSSWNKFGEHIDDATIRVMADTLVTSGLRDAGYIYVNIDDGWQGERDAAGRLRSNARFPDMKALADYVHARGLKLGLYTSPGPRTCAGYVGSYGHVRQDAATFAAWGVDYLKYDLCSGEWFYDDADSVRRVYQEMGMALRATGRPIVYSLCEYGRFDVADWGRAAGGHLWRTTGDITDDYKTMSDIGFVRNPRFPHAGPGGWNDPDMLEVGNGGMSEDEYRTHITLWAIQAAPLLMGHDLRQTSRTALALLANREVVAVDQDPLGAQGGPLRRSDGLEIWTKPLSGGGQAVALFNRTDATATISLPDSIAAGRMRDLWRGIDVPATTRNFAVPAHGAVLLRTVAG